MGRELGCIRAWIAGSIRAGRAAVTAMIAAYSTIARAGT